MAMEKERGISITASVLQFEHAGLRVNLIDTPGHEDFSEDTYRALTAADSAIMVLDNRKGVEAQTRKLFAVCSRRRLPIFTFVNKCDRAGADPVQLLDDVQADLGIRCFAANWPIRREGRLIGLCDRREGNVHVYERTDDHGQTRPEVTTVDVGDPRLGDLIGSDAARVLKEELLLLAGAGEPIDEGALRRGEATAVYFGSALTNVGVDVLLARFLELAPAPGAVMSNQGLVDPVTEPFSGFVFKVQANMDPRHRDRVAFVRVCSGRLTPGMEATIHRTGRILRLAQPQEFLAGERTHGEGAVAGDVVGLLDRGSLRVGDTLAVSPALEYPGVPRFSPEHFAKVRLDDPMRRKQLDRGLRHLAEEGTVLLLYAGSLTGPVPILGAVGRLQFDVLVDRLKREYGVQIGLEPLSFQSARWVTGEEREIRRVADSYGRMLVEDAEGLPMILFDSEWVLKRTAEEKRIRLHDVQPGTRESPAPRAEQVGVAEGASGG
jgi:peptide chain release factor 3